MTSKALDIETKIVYSDKSISDKAIKELDNENNMNISYFI